MYILSIWYHINMADESDTPTGDGVDIDTTEFEGIRSLRLQFEELFNLIPKINKLPEVERTKLGISSILLDTVGYNDDWEIMGFVYDLSQENLNLILMAKKLTP